MSVEPTALLMVFAAHHLSAPALDALKADLEAAFRRAEVMPASEGEGADPATKEELARLREAVTWLVSSERCRPGEVLLREALGLDRRGGSVEAPLLDPQVRVCAKLVGRMPWTRPTVDRLSAENSGWRILQTILRAQEA